MWTKWTGGHPKPGVKVLYKHPHLRASDDFPQIKLPPYHIFVIFFTRAKFLENKIYTEKRQFFALNLQKTPLFGVKSIKNAKFLH